ncbi:MAG: DUF1349 domain-containing protein [Saprospiraceae bacterium]|nr:DUF1349 domain-containing protein [Saprospiraceae bacterium]
MKNYFFFILLFALSCTNISEPKKAEESPKKAVSFEQLSGKYGLFTEGLNGPMDKCVKSEGDKITMTAGKETDFFIEPGSPPYEFANAPLLLMPVDNTKPFTFSFKTTPVHTVKYDAGMAFLYVDNKHWLKFAFEADERLNHRLVTVKTKDFSDDNNHDAVKSSSVFMKISSDTKVVGFYYSIDGKEWQLVRVFKNEYPTTLHLGIGTQSPTGQGNQSVFEQIEFKNESVKDFRMGI